MAQTLGLELLDYAVGGATADNNIVQGYTVSHKLTYIVVVI